MRSLFVSRLAVAVGLSMLALPAVVAAQQCASNAGMYYDNWPNTQTVVCGSMASNLTLATFSGKPYVFQTGGCSITIYDVSGTGVTMAAEGSPFGGSNAYGHNDYRLRHIAVLDNFPYGMMSMSSEGWAVFKINTNANGITGIALASAALKFYFGDGSAPVSSQYVYGSALFQTGGRTYVVGRWLDKASFALAIHDFGDGSALPPMTRMSTLPDVGFSSLIRVLYDSSNTPYVYVFTSAGAHIYRVSNPSSPVYLGLATDDGLRFTYLTGSGPSYPRGTAVANVSGGGKRLYTYPQAGYFYILDVTDPAAPVQRARQAVTNGNFDGSGIATDGKLLAALTQRADGQPMVRLYSVSDDQVSEITHTINWSTSDPAFSYESSKDVAVVPPTAALPTHYKVLRTHAIRAFHDTVSAGCLSSTPTAGVGAMRSTTVGSATCTGGHSGAAKGFPGDQFKITNLSTGFPPPTVQSLVITDVATGGTAYNSGDIKALLASNELTWTAPSALTGELVVTLTLAGGGGSATAYIYLCNDPDADVAVSQCRPPGGSFGACSGWLQGYTLRLSGLASEGNPDWAEPPPVSLWTVEYKPNGGSYGPAAPGDFVNNSNGTLDLTLNSTGDYRVTLDPEYGYTDATPEKTDAVEVHSGAVTATVVVTQDAANVADGGFVLTSSDVTVAWSGQCSGGNQNCSFAWTGLPIACSTATCIIPAGTMVNNQQVNASLLATHTPTGDTASDTHSFTASNCTPPGAPPLTAPAAGATLNPGTVTFQWNEPSGTGPFTYRVMNSFGSTLCGPTGSLSCSASFTSSGATTWFVRAENLCGTGQSASRNFTISGGSQCTPPGSPSLVSPAAGASVSAGTVTFSWSSVSGSSPITYTVKTSLGATLCSSTGTSCSANLSAGNYSWFVQASNACSSGVNSTSRALTVSGSSCVAPGNPSPTSPAAGATVTAGTVTFSWPAVTGTTPITYAVRTSLGGTLCSTTGTSCSASLSAGNYTWFVRATNDCSVADSASRTLTVGPACTTPGTPLLVSPASGATVNGGTVTFSWNPVTGTTPITYKVYKTGGIGGPPLCETTATSCSYTFTSSGAVTWRVDAVNTCGTTPSAERGFTLSLCAATAAPVANFTWSPNVNLVMANGYQQPQPYVGQLVTLTNTSTNGPFTDVSWYDFGVPGGVGTIKTTNTSYTWPSAGNKNVRLTVANCFGPSTEKLQAVPIAADGRGVVADFTFTPAQPTVGQPVTFTARTGPEYGDPDEFTWSATINGIPFTVTEQDPQIVNAFGCGEQVAVTLTVRSTARNRTSTPATKSLVIGGTPACCAASSPPSASPFVWEEQGNLLFQGMQQPQPYAGQLVHFRGDPSPSSATAWAWNLGDGQPHNQQNPTFTFPQAGTYPVSLVRSNCAGSAAPVAINVQVFEDVRPVTSDFTWTPGTPAVGAAATFTANDGFAYGDPNAFEWTFPGNVKKNGKVVTHAFTCGGANQVTLISKRGSVAGAPATKTVTTTGTPSCCRPPNAAGSPVPSSGGTIPGGLVTLRWAQPTTGTAPLTYDVYLGGTSGSLAKLPECSDLTERQCTTNVPDGTATWFWKVVAKNECGTTSDNYSVPEWRFKACSATSAPEATSFTWSPSGPIEVDGVTQQQPFVGQEVTFSYNPVEDATSWLWTDYQTSPATSYTVASPVIVYASPGDKKMYLRATNCAGSRQITQYIHVFEDIRPVKARFTMSPESPESLMPVTFTFDASNEAGNPNQFTIDFGDGTPPLTTAESNVQHAYSCAKLYRPTLTATRIKPGSTVTSEPNSQDLQVAGYPCAASELLVVDMVRQAQGSNGVAQRGDMVIFNPTNEAMLLAMTVRDSSTGEIVRGLPLPLLPPQGSLSLTDLTTQLGLGFSSASLWFGRLEEGAESLPVINAWSYVEPTAGAKYGQFLPVFQVWPASNQATTRWITGLVHNSINAERGRYGFVTWLTFIDPTLNDPGRVPWGTKKLTLKLYDNSTGQLLKTDSLNLDGSGGYRRDYLNRFFHLSDLQDLKAVTVKVEVPAGVSVIVTSSMFDNYTANAVVFPSQTLQ